MHISPPPMGNCPLNILIVDDHDIVVRGIAMIVNDALSGYQLNIDTATRGCKALELMSLKHYDLCFLDIEMPDIDGLGMLKVIRSEHPEIKVIVNTIHEELWYVKDYVRQGVEGILFKSVNADEIKTAVRSVLIHDDRYFCARARALLKIINGYNPPTPKELEVLQHLASGKSTDDIARFMGLSVHTVESHRRHLLDKLGARNVAELIMNAVSEGLLNVKK